MLATYSLYHVPYHNDVAKFAIALNVYKLFTILLQHDNVVYMMHEAHILLIKCLLILYIFNVKECR